MAADRNADEPLLAGADDCPPCELLSLVGETSRALTFLGEQTWPVRRLVVLKLFKADAGCLVANLERSLKAPLSPIITPAAERGRIGDRLYAVTPYFAGGSLPQCHDRLRLAPAARIAALLTVAEAVARAHAHGLPHGHLAPANVLCDSAPPFGVHIVDIECNAGKLGASTPDALIHDDVVRLIALVNLLLQRSLMDGGETSLLSQGLERARTAEDVRDALELLAQLGP